MNIEEAQRDESVCNVCNTEMTLVKAKRRKNRWDKCHDFYVCPACGFTHRKRTYNEILRDIGERE
jgi:uncharacterized protein with PIN domain